MNTPVYEETLDEAMNINLLMEEYSHIPPSNNIGIITSLEYMYEANEAYNAFKQFIGLEDIKYFSKHNTVLFEDYTIEAQGEQKNILSKAIDIVLGWLSKIKEFIGGVFKAIQNKMDEINLSNKVFLKKYEKQLSTIDEFTYDGYDYALLVKPNVFESDYVSDFINNPDFHLPSDFKDKMVELIGYRVLGKDVFNSCRDVIDNPTEFPKRISEVYNGTKMNRPYKIKTQMDIMRSFGRDKIEARKLYAQNMASLKSMELMLKGMKNLNLNVEAREKFDTCIELVQFHSNLAKVSFDIYTSKLIERCTQAKKICEAALVDSTITVDVIESSIDNKYNNESLQDIFSSII